MRASLVLQHPGEGCVLVNWQLWVPFCAPSGGWELSISRRRWVKRKKASRTV